MAEESMSLKKFPNSAANKKRCKNCRKFIPKEKTFCNDVCNKINNTHTQKEKIAKKNKWGRTKCEKCGGFGKVFATKYLNQKQIQRSLKCTKCHYKFKKIYNLEELSQRKKIIPKKCLNCKKYFVKEKQYATDQAIFCKRECYWEMVRKRRYDRNKRICLNCNKEFSKRRQIFCDRKCAAEAAVKNKAWRPTGNYVYRCVVCDREFERARATRNKIKTCSEGCKHISSKSLPSHLWKKFQDKKYRQTYSHINGLLKGYIERNKERWKKPCNLTVEYLISILPKNSKCPVLNYDMHCYSTKKQENKLSLDRIDNEKGYVRGNVMWISLKANRWKNDFKKHELLKFCNFWTNYYANEKMQGLLNSYN
tara:strand:- start:40 stop:1134 length:1095 start_codon:yes stop_codon:yes gene_type:complete